MQLEFAMPRYETAFPSTLGRPLVALGLCLAVIAGPGAAVASDEASMDPGGASASPGASPVSPALGSASSAPALASPPVAASASPGASLSSAGQPLFPLPQSLVVVPPDIPTVSVEAASEPGLVVGTAVPFTLEHCGLLSPVDADGSLWMPVAGHDASGGPVDSDEDIGEFINATPGELTLVSADRAELVTVSGQVLAFERAPGALDYGMCM
jgi:hypothetical protein